jgi:hypothetical protein
VTQPRQHFALGQKLLLEDIGVLALRNKRLERVANA